MGSIIYIPKRIYPVKFGLLYNWFAVKDSRNIAASGWHVATNSEWAALRTFVGTGANIYNIMSIESTWWNKYPFGTNTHKFNARGSARRSHFDGTFLNLKDYAYWYTSTDSGGDSPWGSFLYPATPNFTNILPSNKSGYSIRLVKDSTILTNGQSGTYRGTDGKLYRTICIDGKEWLADNLAETKYRNGDTIPEVTDNSAWIALTTGALCAYNNNWNNV